MLFDNQVRITFIREYYRICKNINKFYSVLLEFLKESEMKMRTNLIMIYPLTYISHSDVLEMWEQTW